MKHPVLTGLLVLSLVIGYGLFGNFGTVTAAPGESVALEGSVTGPTGEPASDAVVLIGQYGMLSKFSPTELRDIIDDDPQGLKVVDVDQDGEFAATIDWERADAAIALNASGISETIQLGRENQKLSLQLHKNRPQTVYAHAGSVSADEQQSRLFVSLVNNDDVPVENLTVTIDSLPNEWTVETVATEGVYHSENRTLKWASVSPGDEVDTTIELTVPADTDVGTYEIGLQTISDSHHVSVESETVEVLPVETAGPTQTVTGGEGSTPTALVNTPVESTSNGQTGGTQPSAPGFAVGVALIALSITAVWFRWREL